MKHEITLKEFFDALTDICDGYCSYPNDCRIFRENSDEGELLVVMPHTADYPKFIGRQGRQVNAFLWLCTRAGSRNGWKIGFAVRETFEGSRDPVEPFVFNPKFDVKKAIQLLSILTAAAFDNAQAVVGENTDMLSVTIKTPRGNDNETTVIAIEAVLRPYCHHNGRKLQLRPEYTNEP